MFTSMCNRKFTYCALKYLRSNILRCHWRTVYSLTGQWDRTFNKDVRDELEKYWKPILEEQNATKTVKSHLPKYYVLSMFPYPSGKLHMGHVRVYTISDTMARYHRLTGKQVIHPMGWDAFGLPAENAAIERGERPDLWTRRNIESMRKQLKDLGCSFDWEREFATCESEYYRWTQYIFLQMYKAGLIYQREAEVNWDPVDQTVLADEQIDDTGLSWRSGAKVEKRYLRQWYIRTTAYAKSLLDGLEEVNSELWQDIIQLQKNWIRDCSGCRLDFKLKYEGQELEDPLSIHTDVPELVYEVSHVCLSPQHRYNTPQHNKAKVKDANDATLSKLTAIHPLTGKELPVVIATDVEYGEFNDTLMAIPSHCDEHKAMADTLGFEWSHIVKDGVLVNSEQFSGLKLEEAKVAIMEFAKKQDIGGHAVGDKLKDWLISRQRYWGTPIPVIHCPRCKTVPVPESDLPVELPIVEELTGRGLSPLVAHPSWSRVTCPKCGREARRETDTMDTFVDSSWYFLRYLDPRNTSQPFSREAAHKNMPVDLYIGGKEHAVLHLYFARFFNHFLHDHDLLPSREPFVDLLTQGMVMGQTYRVKGSGRYVKQDEVDFSGEKPVEKGTGAALVVAWEKMSKSKHNGVDPQEVISEFGVDTTRLCIMSAVAPQTHRKWSNEAFKGIIHWQSRVWTLVSELLEQNREQAELPKEDVKKTDMTIYENRNYFLKEVSFHFKKTFLLNVAISRLQGLTNALKKVPGNILSQSEQCERAVCDLVIMMSPIAPHFASELWAGLASRPIKLCQNYQWDKGVLEQSWPLVDTDFPVPLIVKINGQESSQIPVAVKEFENLTLETAHDLARVGQDYKQYCEGREFKDIEFSLEPGYRATVNFIVPSSGGKRKDKKEKKEKKNKKKKVHIYDL